MVVTRKINHSGIIGQTSSEVNSSVNVEILREVSSTGKERPWVKHKRDSKRLAKLYAAANDDAFLISDKRLQALESCGDYLEFVNYSDGTKKFRRSNFCKLRLCPMCQWRRSLKLSWRLYQAMEKSKDKCRFLFVTFTQKNCAGADLRDELIRMSKAFSSMLRRKPLNGLVVGSCRTFELTINLRDMTYHPHIHAVLAVKPSYFTGRYYLKQSRWRELWQGAMKLDYLPQVSVKAVDADVAFEAAKYETKGLSLLDKLADIRQSVEVLTTVHKALYHKRLVSFTGFFKAISFDDLNDIEGDSELNVAEVAEGVEEIGYTIYRWTPKAGVYVLSERFDSGVKKYCSAG